MTLGTLLPPLNATLNATSATLAVLGWRAIRAGDRVRHRRLMLGAVCASVLFLVGYLTRVALTGTHAFPGDGALRAVYLAILASHTVLAVVAAPMVLRALFLGLRERFKEHRRIALATLAVWLYVSVTGVAVYLILYRISPYLTRPVG